MPSQDQIIDAMMARSIQVDVVRTHPLLAWVVVRDEAAYPRQVRSAPGDGCYYSLRLAGRHAGRAACQASSRPGAV